MTVLLEAQGNYVYIAGSHMIEATTSCLLMFTLVGNTQTQTTFQLKAESDKFVVLKRPPDR